MFNLNTKTKSKRANKCLRNNNRNSNKSSRRKRGESKKLKCRNLKKRWKFWTPQWRAKMPRFLNCKVRTKINYRRRQKQSRKNSKINWPWRNKWSNCKSSSRAWRMSTRIKRILLSSSWRNKSDSLSKRHWQRNKAWRGESIHLPISRCHNHLLYLTMCHSRLLLSLGRLKPLRSRWPNSAMTWRAKTSNLWIKRMLSCGRREELSVRSSRLKRSKRRPWKTRPL